MATDKNITMKQFNGTDYDTLYPKTIASQIPDVYSKSETYPQSQLYTRSQLYTKSQIDSMINSINSALNGKAKIQTGSYVGTGTYGANNPCSLTFDFMPKYVQICPFRNSMVNFIGLFYYSPQKMFSGHILDKSSGSKWFATDLSVSVDGNTITWYGPGNDDFQLNYNDTPYYYVAIG